MIMVVTLIVMTTPMNIVTLQMTLVSIVSMVMVTVPVQMVIIMCLVKTLDARRTKLKVAIIFFRSSQMLQIWSC